MTKHPIIQIKEDYGNILKLFEAILILYYNYDAEKKYFVFKFKEDEIKYLNISLINDLTEKQKIILNNSETIEEVLSNLIDDFKRTVVIYERTGVYLQELEDGIIDGLKKQNFLTASMGEAELKDFYKGQFPKLHDTFKESAENLSKYLIELCEEGIKRKKENFRLFETGNIGVYRALLKKTIDKAVKNIKNNDIESYRTYREIWENCYEVWSRSLSKKQPNKVYTALNNLLDYHEIESGTIYNLYTAIIVGFEMYTCHKLDKYSIIVGVLKLAFDKEDIQNKEADKSIRQLCTAKYGDVLIMDGRTFDKRFDSFWGDFNLKFS